MQKQRFEADHKIIRQQLTAGFALSGYLLEAHDEKAAILAAMRVSTDLLGAMGAAFVPFEEWKLTLPALKYGQVDFLQNEDWQGRLYAPATRHACRSCAKKQAGSECVLLQGTTDPHHVFCVSLRCEGREIGLLTYVFETQPDIKPEQQHFLAEMVRLTGLALDALRSHARDVDAARLAQIPQDFREKLLSLDASTEELLEQLEYKAILDERARLAREIHDGLAQTLSFLKLEAARMQSYVAKGEVDALSRTLQSCYQTLSEAYLDARQAIDNLRRAPDESLNDWLELTAADFTTLTGIAVDASRIQFQHTFSQGVKAQLVRIVQEALTNIRKHAHACQVTLSAFEHENTVVLEVRDNGRGFSPEETQPSSQYGLRSMRERAESIGADFQIISTPGAGTVVRLRIPIWEKASL